jgi:hypothetical protein
VVKKYNILYLLFYIFLCVLCGQSFALDGDFTGDQIVDVNDMIIFASNWLQTPQADPNCDINEDGKINFVDYSLMAQNWTGYFKWQPTKASAPDPANEATDIATNQILSWSGEAASYDVYFGTANPPPFLLNQAGSTYDPAIIYDTTYYWRIDAKNEYFTIEGDIWQFTTEVFIDPNQPPTADSNSYTISAYTTATIPLYADDDGLPRVPGKLKYTIRSLPAVGKLYDPASGGGEIKNAPYTLSSYGSQVIFVSTSAGNASFTFDVNDGGTSPNGGKSNTATVSLTISEYTHDSLYVAKPYILADNSHLDLDGQWGIVFWIKTSDLYGTVLQKGNFKVKVINGVLSVDFYDGENSTVYRVTSQRRWENMPGYISDGQWHCVSLYAEPNDVRVDTALHIEVYPEGFDDNYYADGTVVANTHEIDCNNNSDFIIGSNNFKFHIDRLCLFNNSGWVSWDVGVFLVGGSRTNTAYGWGASPPKGAEWRFTEGTGQTTVDAINSLPIDLDDDEWAGKVYLPVDMTVQRRR